MYRLFSDGGSRENPGNAAWAFFIFDDNDNLVCFDAKFIGQATNNFAEYSALLAGLNQAIKLSIKKINCFLDSELVVKQLNGDYKVNNIDIKKFVEQIKELTINFDIIEFIHIPRENNKFADKLVNIVLDSSK